jgi:hypothetical protein
MSWAYCPKCRERMPARASRCPRCGAAAGSHRMLLAAALLACIMGVYAYIAM